MAKLGEYTRISTRKNKNNECAAVYSVTNSQGFVPSAEYFSKEVFSKELRNYQLVNEGMIAYNPSRINVGSVALQDKATCVIVSPLYVVFSVDQTRLIPEYVVRFLKSRPGLDQVAFRSIGTVRNNLKYDALSQMDIAVPSLEVQARCVAALKAVEKQICMTEQSLAKLDELVKSRFVEMFGDTYLNTKQFESQKLGDLVSFMTSGSRGWAKYYSDEGEYFITIKNVKNCGVSTEDVQFVHAPHDKEAKRTKVQEGDVLISITADLGRTGVVTREIAEFGAYINQHLACIRLGSDLIEPLYLAYYLESPGGVDQFTKKNQNGVKAGLNFNLVKSLDVLLPPLTMQRDFISFVQQVDKLKFAAQQQIGKLQELYDSLAQEYFGC